MIPLVVLYRLINGSIRHRSENAVPNENDPFRADMQ
jgi:hypothetical protein